MRLQNCRIFINSNALQKKSPPANYTSHLSDCCIRVPVQRVFGAENRHLSTNFRATPTFLSVLSFRRYFRLGPSMNWNALSSFAYEDMRTEVASETDDRRKLLSLHELSINHHHY